MTMEELNQAIRTCRGCRLAETRTNALCGEGDVRARVMLVAQAPGENEDKAGRMFIGPSGKVLDELLEAAGVDRKRLYMTNLVKCMLPKCRRPKTREIAPCSGFLDREIELVDPEFIVPLGWPAARYLFEKYGIPVPSREEISKISGTLLPAGKRRILPLRHPAAILYDDSLKEGMARTYRKLQILFE